MRLLIFALFFTLVVTKPLLEEKINRGLWPDKETEVCYDNVGCFSKLAPFEDLPLPKSPDLIAPKYHVFSRVEGVLESTLYEASSAHVYLNRRTVIIIHGYAGNKDNTAVWHEPIAGEILANDDVNVIFVEWEAGAEWEVSTKIYSQAASNTRVVGRMTGNWLTAAGLLPEDTHCVGFSLGAHVCGFLGKWMQTQGRMLDRISALDPAGPNFDKDAIEARISPDSAKFVDAIHTSRFGLARPVGDIDFYPNGGGPKQPACWFRHANEEAIEETGEKGVVSWVSILPM